MVGNEELCDRTAAVARDDVDLADRECVEKCSEHRYLRVGCQRLMLGNLGIPEPHEIGRDAASLWREPLDGAAPLEAVERRAMQEQRSLAGAAFDISDSAEARLGEARQAAECGRVQWLRCIGRGTREAGRKRGAGKLQKLSASHLGWPAGRPRVVASAH